MNYLDAVLVAQARASGRAVRSASLRHRHLATRPLAMLLWQLGAEPFTAAAVAWGFGIGDRHMVAPGEPRDRELAFRALTQVARTFNPWFEAGRFPDGSVRQEAPQIIVPNRGNLTLLRRLARRLAWLPTDGARPADPELVRFGRHLWFLTDHARTPGQQLIVGLTDFLNHHWVTELSTLEAQSLPALDAWIEPPRGLSGHQAAILAEAVEIGPAPGREEDEAVDPLVTRFNEARGRGTEERMVAPLRAPIERHYSRLVDRGWPLIWRVLAREQAIPEAPSVRRRWEADTTALERHLEYTLTTGGRRRTRQTHAQAARTLKDWENAQGLCEAEEVTDDPLRMVAALVDNKAIAGTVVGVDLTNRERPNVKLVLRPLVTLETHEACTMPAGTELWWSRAPGGAAWLVRSVTALASGGSRVVLCQQSGGPKQIQPSVGDRVVFSVYSTTWNYILRLPDHVPWTHRNAAETPPTAVESESERWE